MSREESIAKILERLAKRGIGATAKLERSKEKLYLSLGRIIVKDVQGYNAMKFERYLNWIIVLTSKNKLEEFSLWIQKKCKNII